METPNTLNKKGPISLTNLYFTQKNAHRINISLPMLQCCLIFSYNLLQYCLANAIYVYTLFVTI